MYGHSVRVVPRPSKGFWARWKVKFQTYKKVVYSGCFANSLRFENNIRVGVTDVQTNVEAKKVHVTADENVSPQEMLEKLQKVRLDELTALHPYITLLAKSNPLSVT